MGISLLITRAQKAALRERGFSEETIRHMKPEEAHSHLLEDTTRQSPEQTEPLRMVSDHGGAFRTGDAARDGADNAPRPKRAPCRADQQHRALRIVDHDQKHGKVPCSCRDRGAW